MNYRDLTIEQLLELIEARCTDDEIRESIAQLDIAIRATERDIVARDRREGVTFRTEAMLEHRRAVTEAEMRGFREGMGL